MDVKHKRGAPDRVRLAAQFEDIEETDAGWTFQMWAQFFGVVNDRLWVFRKGCARKTIAERVKTNRVKVHDGHNWSMDTRGTLGRVLSAREEATGGAGFGGIRYTGFLSRSHEDVAQKLADGTISENSLELYRMKTRCIEVPLDQIPPHRMDWVELTPEGQAKVLEITEMMWLAIGLVSGSSQDRGALIEAPVVVSYQDLPVALGRWDPEGARERIAEYSHLGADDTDWAALGRAHLVQLSGGRCLGLIADIDDSGRLAVNPQALGSAYAEVAAELEGHLRDPAAVRQTLASCSEMLARYSSKLTAASDLTRPTGPAISGPDDQGAAEDGKHEAAVEAVPASESVTAPPAPQGGAEPSAGTPTEEPPSHDTHSDTGAEAATEALKALDGRLKLLPLRQRLAERGVRNEPASTSGGPPS
jgi:hypothetical protein